MNKRELLIFVEFLIITLCSLIFIYPIEIMRIRSLYTIMILTTIILAAYTYHNRFIYAYNLNGFKWY